MDDKVVTNNYGAFDVDGDGNIDAEELKLAKELQRHNGIDVNSVEVRKQSDLLLELQHAGRRVMAKKICKKHGRNMWNFYFLMLVEFRRNYSIISYR